MYGSDQEVAELMRAVSRKKATGIFTWIGSDGWSARSLVSQGKNIIENTLFDDTNIKDKKSVSRERYPLFLKLIL